MCVRLRQATGLHGTCANAPILQDALPSRLRSRAARGLPRGPIGLPVGREPVHRARRGAAARGVARWVVGRNARAVGKQRLDVFEDWPECALRIRRWPRPALGRTADIARSASRLAAGYCSPAQAKPQPRAACVMKLPGLCACACAWNRSRKPIWLESAVQQWLAGVQGLIAGALHWFAILQRCRGAAMDGPIVLHRSLTR